MKNAKWKEPVYALLFFLLAALLTHILSLALRPVRVNFGSVWGSYLAEPKDSLDYLYLGSSYAYCDVNPALIYDKTGLTGYVLAGPEQTLSLTYWYLREALKTQTPALVVLEASAFQFKQYQDYTQVNVDYMPHGLNRLGAIFTAAEPELRTGLFFGLYFYHNRWKEITAGQVRSALTPPQTDLLKGYTSVEGVFDGIDDGPFTRETQPDEVYQANLKAFSQIATLCQKNNIPLAVVIHPTYSQIPAQARAEIQADVTALGASFYDWTEDTAAIGLTPSLHYFDPGHLNRTGADLFSAWLGAFFTDVLNLSPRPQTAENAAAWSEAVHFWLTPQSN